MGEFDFRVNDMVFGLFRDEIGVIKRRASDHHLEQ